MRTSSVLFFITIVLVGAIISSCETKVDLIDEGKESAVVFGFLDPTVDTQFVKITKTFVTEGSAIDAAQDPEISEYDNLQVTVIAFDGNDTVESYLLQEKTVTNKDSGAFYYPVQTVYYFTEPLNVDYDYEISFFGSDKNVVSKTEVVGDFRPNNSTVQDINLVTSINGGKTTYRNQPITLNSSENVRRYEYTFRFHYTEVYTDGTQKEKVFDMNFPAWKTDNLNGSEDNKYNIEGEVFYQSLGAKINAQNNEDNVEKRIIGTMDHIFSYAGEDLNTFVELNEPSTSINVEQNPYSNITNAIGVWSSRGITEFDGLEFETVTSNSYEELALGQYTAGLKFCSTKHPNESWFCN